MKERFEWIRTWCDETNQHDLPRVLLAGDSITHGYSEKVREKLRGVAYVDEFASSYALDSALFRSVISSFIRDSDYALLHFNNGLHGIHLGREDYRQGLCDLLGQIWNNDRPLILATTTVAYEPGNEVLHHEWEPRVKERNEVVAELIAANGYLSDDLGKLSRTVAKEARAGDGVHYAAAGYEILAGSVAASIRRALGKE